MRRARLRFRLRMERLSRHAEKSAASSCRPDLRESDRLPEPIFTPATKAVTGHDENISFEQAAALIGKELAERVRERQHRNLPARREICRAARHFAGRHEIRIRPAEEFRWRRRTHLDRRSAHSGFLALLARRAIRSRRTAAFVRQTVCARLSRTHSVAEDAARVRSCLPMSSPRPAQNTAKPIASWSDTNWIRQ